MEFETNNFEENIPLEEKNEWEEDEEGYFLETSFGGRHEPFYDDPNDEPQSLIFYPWSEVPAETQLKEIEKAKRIFLYKIFDKQLSPSYSDKCKNLFNRLELKTTGVNGEDMLLFDGEIVARKKKGEGYQRELGSFQLSRFEALFKEAVDEYDTTPLGKFERELEDKFGIEEMVPKDGEPIFLLRDSDETRLLRFRQFARKYLFLFAGVAIAVASALTAIILVTRQALKKTAKRFKRQKVSPSDKIVPSQEEREGGGEIIPDSLNWLSDNLLIVVEIVIFLFLFYNY